MVKKKDQTTTAGDAELLVSVERFTSTRDSVIMSLTNLQAGLTHVQNGLTELLQAYVQHSASILAGGADVVDSLSLPPHLAENANAAIQAAQSAGNAVATVAKTVPTVEGGKKKRKREKKERDPNAPKRPLTAAFLYAQTARPIIKEDLQAALGPDQKLEPNAVNLEVTKRWNELPEEHKEQWKQSYRDSMEKYKEEMKAYAASNGAAALAELHDEEEASDEAEAGALDSEASSDEDEVAAALANKAPSPPAGKGARPNKRQKTAAQVNGALPTLAPASGTPVPLPVSKTAAETPASGKKDKKKKEKAAPAPIAPAPAKDASPEKKNKSSRTTRNTEGDAAVAEKENKGTKKRDRSKRKSEGATA